MHTQAHMDEPGGRDAEGSKPVTEGQTLYESHLYEVPRSPIQRQNVAGWVPGAGRLVFNGDSVNLGR